MGRPGSGSRRPDEKSLSLEQRPARLNPTCANQQQPLWRMAGIGLDEALAAQADLDRLGTEPLAPPSADRTVTEPTFEGVRKLFAEGQPSLAIFVDEGGQFIGGHAIDSDNRLRTLTAQNDLWQGNPIRRTRAGDRAAILVAILAGQQRPGAIATASKIGVTRVYQLLDLMRDAGRIQLARDGCITANGSIDAM